MQITAVYFRQSTVLGVPDGDVAEKHSLSSKSTYDYTWEMEYIPTLRMVKVVCSLNGRHEAFKITHVPLENVASMDLVCGPTHQGGVGSSPPKK